jgi:glycine cleavage system H lipoate-binding protein
MEHGTFLSIYSAKAAEYLLAIGYLLLFVPFWRYVQGGRPAPAHAGAVKGAARAATRPAAATAPAGARAPAGPGWFQVPADVWLHPGHTWARLEEDGLVAVGADDFAHKLVGSAKVTLPVPGDHVMQGEPALELGDGGKSVPMLSPVDGTVVAVNSAAQASPEGLEDPYGGSWLFKVKAPRLAANLRQLLRDGPARRFMADAETQLQLRLSPALGQVLQDGGAPVHGLARALSGDDWDETARQFFLT